MSKDDASRNFIIVVRSQDLWTSFLQLNAEFKETIQKDLVVEGFQPLIPSHIVIGPENVVRRLSFINQRSLASVQKKIKSVAFYCVVDPRDLRTKDYRPITRKKKRQEEIKGVRCCDCERLIAIKYPSQSTSFHETSVREAPDRRQDLNSFETLEKKVKIESTKIEC